MRYNHETASNEAAQLTESLKKEYPNQDGNFETEQYAVFDLLGDASAKFDEIVNGDFEILIPKDLTTSLPEEFLRNPKQYLIEHGNILKSSSPEDKYPDEEIISVDLGYKKIIAKKVEGKKARVAKKELAILVAAENKGLPTAKPFGYLNDKESGNYLLMETIPGISLNKFLEYLKSSGQYDQTQIGIYFSAINREIENIANDFRTKLNIDKKWYIKDFMIDFDEEKKVIRSITAIDWERAKKFNPEKPLEIELIKL